MALNIDRLQRGLLLGLAALSPILPLQSYLGGEWSGVLHSYSLGMVFGIIAYVYFANCLILSSRVRYFDRVFGHDRVLAFHGRLAGAALCCMIVHAILKYIYYGLGTTQVNLGILAASLFAAVGLMTLLFMVDTGLQRLKPFARVRSFAVSRLGFDYSRIKLFHNLTAAAVLIMTVHVLMAAPTAETTSRMVMAGAWGVISLCLYVYHKLIRPGLRYRRRLKVIEVTQPSSNVTKIIAQRSDGAKLKYRAGQFGYFRLLSKKCGIEEHPFTIASAPDSDTLDIAVKSLGDYSARLRTVEPGTKMIVDGPYGIFCPEKQKCPYLFIAGGIGITPFLSIVSSWKRDGITWPVTLIWTVKRNEDLVDGGLFSRMAEENNDFTYTPIVTGRDGNGKRIDRDLLAKYVREDCEAYICGPDGMRKSVQKLLHDIGMRKTEIHYESFSF